MKRTLLALAIASLVYTSAVNADGSLGVDNTTATNLFSQNGGQGFLQHQSVTFGFEASQPGFVDLVRDSSLRLETFAAPNGFAFANGRQTENGFGSYGPWGAAAGSRLQSNLSTGSAGSGAAFGTSHQRLDVISIGGR
ncbi:MAG: hypothetical protein UY63_C0018G0002 [Parcubacteria group bacterium GW2011_GWA2_51_10]|nr:MAG: hypothetical protein UY63_C0018G0002 [Parcubacteria group bacterium GW2011_GWA2_51_10]